MKTNKYEEFSKVAQAKIRQQRLESHRKKSCENKVAFDELSLAEKTGNDVYRCEFCGKWHTSGSIRRFVKTLIRIVSVKRKKSKKKKIKTKLSQKLQ
jgi:Zn-finger protein